MRTQTSRYLQFFELEVNSSVPAASEPHRVHGPGQFVLGYAEERVTLFSQQVRALNLAYALNCVGRLRRGTSVLIVGAGPAGITLGAAARLMGANVTILERANFAMAVFAPVDVGGRYIQPLAAEWPAARSIKTEAGLPVCSWRAGDGRTIAKTIAAGFRRAQATAIRFHPSSDPVHFYYGADHLHVEFRPGNTRPWYSSWNSRQPSERLVLSDDSRPDHLTNKSHHDSFDLVIFAFGPGKERPWLSLNNRDMVVPYFSKSSNTARLKCPVLVSGAGDGGLVDVILHQTGHSHRSYMQALEDHHSEFSRLREELLLIERNAISSSSRTIDVIAAYRQLRGNIVDDFYEKILPDKGRNTTLLAKDGQWLRPQAQPLHRFCCWLLENRGRLTAQAGEVPQNARPDATRRVFRHGPVHSDELARDVLTTLKAQMHKKSVLDFTRDPIWPDGFFPVVKGDVEAGIAAKTPATHKVPKSKAAKTASMLTEFDSVSASATFEIMDADPRGWVKCEGRDTIKIRTLAASQRFYLDHDTRAVDGARMEVRSGTFKPVRKGDTWTFSVERGQAHAIPETSMAYSITGPVAKPRTLELEWGARPYGPCWCPDGYGYPIYSDMQIGRLSFDITMVGLTPFHVRNGKPMMHSFVIARSHFRRRDYAEISSPIVPQPTFLERSTPYSKSGDSDGYKKAIRGNDTTRLMVSWKNPMPGIFYMIMWDGLIPIAPDGKTLANST